MPLSVTGMPAKAPNRKRAVEYLALSVAGADQHHWARWRLQHQHRPTSRDFTGRSLDMVDHRRDGVAGR